MSEGSTAYKHKDGHVVPERYRLWKVGNVTGRKINVRTVNHLRDVIKYRLKE